MAFLFGQEYSKTDILRRVSDMRQLAAALPFELVDGFERGTRGVRLYNAAGLDMNVITQHGQSRLQHYESAGKHWLGLEIDDSRL